MVQKEYMNSKLPIIIVGLRRSGTTAFWECFRKDNQLCCYDEPFNPNLVELPRENCKGTRKEFISLYENNPVLFKKLYCPVYPHDETRPSFNEHQIEYFKWLLFQRQKGEAVVVDCVRINFKLEDLYRSFPNSVLVHLHRQPIAWISSHMFPSGKGTWRKYLANIYRRMTVWHRKGFYNNWQYQEIIEREIKQGADWRAAQINAGILEKFPAVTRLAYFWKWAFRETEEKGRTLWGDKFISVSFEKFCTQPVPVMDKVYKTAGIEKSGIDYSHLKSANQGFIPYSVKWKNVLQ